jgi:hypothetical protein
MIGTKLNAQVIIKNLRNMHGEVLSAHGSARENGTGISGLGPARPWATGRPACKAGDHTRADPKTA